MIMKLISAVEQSYGVAENLRHLEVCHYLCHSTAHSNMRCRLNVSYFPLQYFIKVKCPETDFKLSSLL